MAMNEAPLYVPVEISRLGDPLAPRWFRLAIGISAGTVRLRSAVPDDLREGPLVLRLQLPEDTDPGSADAAARGPLLLHGEATEVVVDAGEETEHAEARLVQLRGVPDVSRGRIDHYVARRLDDDSAGHSG